MTDVSNKEQAARQICQVLRERGFRALLAGGCVRDWLLGVAPRDYDIATDARVHDIRGLFDRTLEVGAEFGVTVVVLPEGQFEVASFRRDGPYLDGRHPSSVAFVDEREDALRRDFTINALFLDPETDAVLDYVGGREDLKQEILRAVGDPRKRFEEDNLRLLRAVRFSARLGYPIEADTYEAMRVLAPRISRTSAERVRDELVKVLTEGGARRAFEVMDETGLLKVLLPEVAAMKGVEQPPNFHPEGDVFEHTLLMLEHLRTPSPTLALAALLHDVGKPPTQTFEDRIRFNNHCKAGARMSEKICMRLRLPNAWTERIVRLVEQHMRLTSLPDMRESKRKRLVREEGFEELLELCRLDCLASHRKMDLIEWVETYRAQLSPEEVRPEPLLTGKDLIEIGYAPGPLFKEILTAVEDLQLDGQLGEREEAVAYVRDKWLL